MKKLAVVLIALGLVLPGTAEAHRPRAVVIMPGYGYYYSGWGAPRYYYPGYPTGYVVPPSNVYISPYVAPPVSAPVIYASPPAPYAYAMPAAAPPVTANQTSPTYTNSLGRTCREFQSAGPTYGTACLQPDGSWQIVQ